MSIVVGDLPKIKPCSVSRSLPVWGKYAYRKSDDLTARSKKTPSRITFFDAVSDLNFGIQFHGKDEASGEVILKADGTPKLTPKSFNRAKRVKDWLAAGFAHKLPRLSNADLQNHADRKVVFYYHGKARSSQILVCIDIDAKHGVGSYEGCKRAERAISKLFGNGVKLWWEDSTNGNGRHGYVWLRRPRASAQETNAGLAKLRRYMKRVIKPRFEGQISGIDVQGTCERFEKGVYRPGLLAKVPWNLERAVAAGKTSLDFLNSLAVDAKVKTPKVKAEKKGGSSYSDILPEDAKGFTHYQRVYTLLCGLWNGGQNLRGQKGYVVTPERAGIMLGIMFWAERHKHKDGSFPQRRAEAVWQSLRDQQLITLGWDHRPWTCLRNFLSGLGLITWTSHEYTPGVMGETRLNAAGVGVACKWEIGPELVEMLETAAVETESEQQEQHNNGCLGVMAAQRGIGRRLIPVLIPIPSLISRFDPRTAEDWIEAHGYTHTIAA